MVTTENINKLVIDRKNAELKHLLESHENVDPGFNVFSLISDIYHRENFHSDIIASILDANGKHGGGYGYIQRFIHLLNKFLRAPVDIKWYSANIVVERERGRRDITIKGKDQHTIIIENKINDAGDTNNQIPKYVKGLEGLGFTVDAVIYLTLNQAKEPDETTWEVDDLKRIEIKNKLVSIRAYDGTDKDICNGWLKECIEMTTDLDTLSILRQYFKIIRYLTRKHMDHEYFKTFKEYINNNPDSTEIVIAIANSVNEYNRYILQNIFNHFKLENRYAPFQAINYYSSQLYFLYNYNIAGYSFNTDIIIRDLSECIIDFSVRGEVAYQQPYPTAVLEALSMTNEFQWNNNGRYEHYIRGKFTDYETLVISFIKNFLFNLVAKESEIKIKLLQLGK